MKKVRKVERSNVRPLSSSEMAKVIGGAGLITEVGFPGVDANPVSNTMQNDVNPQ